MQGGINCRDRDRAAVDRGKKLWWQVRVDQAGEKFLADAGLSLNQNRQPRGGDAVCRIQSLQNGIAFADDLQIRSAKGNAGQRSKADR